MTTAPPMSRTTTTRFNESALANYTSNVRNINVRRLLQEDTTVGQCLTGTFSSARGGGPCGGCPPFARFPQLAQKSFLQRHPTDCSCEQHTVSVERHHGQRRLRLPARF